MSGSGSKSADSGAGQSEEESESDSQPASEDSESKRASSASSSSSPPPSGVAQPGSSEEEDSETESDSSKAQADSEKNSPSPKSSPSARIPPASASSSQTGGSTSEEAPESSDDSSGETGENLSDAESSTTRSGSTAALSGVSFAYVFETNEEHKTRHEFPSKVRGCGRCHFLHNWQNWQEQTLYEDPGTGKPRSWLTDTQDPKKYVWHIGCALCSQAGQKNRFGNCRAEPKLSNILRHGRSPSHQAALATFLANAKDKERNEPKGVESFSSSPLAVSYSHIMFQRVLIQTGGSFHSFADWLKTAQLAGADVPSGGMGRKASAQLTEVMAERERNVTSKLLLNASVVGLLQDARDTKVPVLLKLVLWSWPRGLQKDAVLGVESMGHSGAGPPWVALRVAAVGHANDKGQSLINSVAALCPNDAAFSACKQRVRFMCTDGAFDQLRVADSARACFENLRFHTEDESHGALTIMRHAMEADQEISMTDSLFVSGKAPYSLAKFLGTSSHFAALFQQEQVADGLAVLKSFGFAPQRFDSRKKPFSRACQRLRQAFSALAKEAEGTDQKRRACALQLLEGLSGENSHRILLGGLLADLHFEFSRWVHSADESDPDPFLVQHGFETLSRRLNHLFGQGLILSKDNKASFTYQTAMFLKTTKVLHCGHNAFTFSIGDLDNPATLQEPLSRIKAVVGALRAMSDAVRPASSWMVRFTAFRLPSPCCENARQTFPHLTAAELKEEQEKVEGQLRCIWAEANLDVAACWSEFGKLLPAAESHRRGGAAVKVAWARASRDYPELTYARTHSFANRILEESCLCTFLSLNDLEIS